jgi:hypothetical protein
MADGVREENAMTRGKRLIVIAIVTAGVLPELMPLHHDLAPRAAPMRAVQ